MLSMKADHTAKLMSRYGEPSSIASHGHRRETVCNAVVAAATCIKTWYFFTFPSHLIFVTKFSMRNPTITTVYDLDT